MIEQDGEWCRLRKRSAWLRLRDSRQVAILYGNPDEWWPKLAALDEMKRLSRKDQRRQIVGQRSVQEMRLVMPLQGMLLDWESHL